jgi:ribonuclease VapC
LIAVDTSALVAILFREPEADAFEKILFDNDVKLIATPTVLELAVVLENRRGKAAREDGEVLITDSGLVIAAFTADHSALAIEAFLRFGKGRHPAKLNFGDCMSYALAKSLNAPLLYKGTDFGLTDIASAV